jgi:hypothetical protein
LREAAYRICEDEEVIGAMGLINHLVKVSFVKGLNNKRIQTTVRSKGETALLSTFNAATLEEESTILYARERGFSVKKGYESISKGPARVSVQPSNGGSSKGKVLRRAGRGPGFIAQVESEGLMHPGRRVNMQDITNDNTVQLGMSI